MTVGEALGAAAPYYNLFLVAVVVYLLISLFVEKSKKTYLLPWYLLFIGVLVFILEEITTVLRALDVINIPVHINGFFELIIISTFIYMLLLQKEHMRKR